MLAILIAMLVIIGVASAAHIPGKADLCFDCHDLLLTKDEIPKKFSHCGCHRADIWWGGPKNESVDMEMLSKLHNTSPCIRCHIGAGMNASVHLAHLEVKCLACHSEIIRPESNCFYCHAGGVHEIHGRVLKDICTACHGEAAYKFAEEKEEKEAKVTSKIGQFSFYELIRSILSFFF
jgi:hypothetical protein